MSEVDWKNIRKCAAATRDGWRGPEVSAAAAEALADLGPVLDALAAACDAPATDDGMAAIALRLVELRAAWATARAKLGGG